MRGNRRQFWSRRSINNVSGKIVLLNEDYLHFITTSHIWYLYTLQYTEMLQEEQDIGGVW